MPRVLEPGLRLPAGEGKGWPWPLPLSARSLPPEWHCGVWAEAMAGGGLCQEGEAGTRG